MRNVYRKLDYLFSFFSYFFSLHAFGFFVIIFLCFFQFKLFIKILSLCLVIKPLKSIFFFSLRLVPVCCAPCPSWPDLTCRTAVQGRSRPVNFATSPPSPISIYQIIGRQIDRQIYRWMDRQIDIQTERVIDRQLFIQRVRYKDKQVDRQIYRQINIYLSPSYNSNIL